jgi:glycerol-3-phosphate acyltransferase PlsY
MLSFAAIVILGYLVGSIPGSVWTGKLLYGVDVRDFGSGNAGATNVFRVLGWKAGVAATLVDVGKGLFAAGVVGTMIRIDPFPTLPFWSIDTVTKMVAGMAAVAGHMFPVFAGFRGGKGVNTAGGVLFAITPVSMGISVAVFAIVLGWKRYVSLASISAVVAFPTSVGVRKYALGIDSLDASLFILSIIIAAGIIYAHRSNIKRLAMGAESRIGSFRPARGMLGRGEIDESSG